MSKEIDRGHDFAEAVFELVGRLGPEELSPYERAKLSAHLINTAVEWVRTRNRIAKAAAK